jgi:hypothetical protein
LPYYTSGVPSAVRPWCVDFLLILILCLRALFSLFIRQCYTSVPSRYTVHH